MYSLSLYLSFFLSIYLSTSASIYRSICLSTTLLACSIYFLTTHLPYYLSMRPSIHPRMHPSIHPSLIPMSYASIYRSIRSSNCILQCPTLDVVYLRTLYLEPAKARATAKRFLHLGCISSHDVGRPLLWLQGLLGYLLMSGGRLHCTRSLRAQRSQSAS